MAEKKARKRAYIPPSSEVVNRKERTTVQSTRPARGAARGVTPRAGTGNPRSANYVYPEPSLKRTARRLPIYFVMIFLLQYFTTDSKGMSDVQRILVPLGVSAGITIVFAPIMHWMDKASYKRWLKRTGRAEA